MKFKDNDLRDIYAIIAGIPSDRIKFTSDSAFADAADLNDNLQRVRSSGDLLDLPTATAEVWLALHPKFAGYLEEVVVTLIGNCIPPPQDAIDYLSVTSLALRIYAANVRLFAPLAFSRFDGAIRKRGVHTPKYVVLFRILLALKYTADLAHELVREVVDADIRKLESARRESKEAELIKLKQRLDGPTDAANQSSPRWEIFEVNSKKVLARSCG